MHIARAIWGSGHQVLLGDKIVTSDFAQIAANGSSIIRMRIDAGANGRTSHIDVEHGLAREAQIVEISIEHRAKGMKLLADRHRHRILQLGAAHLDHVLEFIGLAVEGVTQQGNSRKETADVIIERNLDRGRIGVVGRLREIDVIVRMQVLVLTLVMPHQSQSDIGNDLITIHIGRGARATLEHIDHELIVVFARQNLITRLANEVALFPI